MHKRKKMAGEISEDEIIRDSIKYFEVNVHNVIFDIIVHQMNDRFMKHAQLYEVLELFDPTFL